jgi:hypothetical protein
VTLRGKFYNQTKKNPRFLSGAELWETWVCSSRVHASTLGVGGKRLNRKQRKGHSNARGFGVSQKSKEKSRVREQGGIFRVIVSLSSDDFRNRHGRALDESYFGFLCLSIGVNGPVIRCPEVEKQWVLQPDPILVLSVSQFLFIRNSPKLFNSRVYFLYFKAWLPQ